MHLWMVRYGAEINAVLLVFLLLNSFIQGPCCHSNKILYLVHPSYTSTMIIYSSIYSCLNYKRHDQKNKKSEDLIFKTDFTRIMGILNNGDPCFFSVKMWAACGFDMTIWQIMDDFFICQGIMLSTCEFDKTWFWTVHSTPPGQTVSIPPYKLHVD